MRIDITFGVERTQLDRYIDPAARKVVIDKARERMVEMFGGCTSTTGIGSWKNADGVMVTETCVTLTSHVGDGPASTYMDDVKEVAEYVRATLNQEAVHIVLSDSTAFLHTF